MAGRKPAFALCANRKDEGGKGSKRKYLDVGAAWPNSYGGFNFSLAKGAKIKLADGTILNGEDFWFSLFDKREKGEDGAGDDDWGDGASKGKSKEWDGKDDPFAGIPARTAPLGQTAEQMDKDLDEIFGGPRTITGSAGTPVHQDQPAEDPSEGDLPL